MYVCIFVCMHVCMYVCMYVCMFVRMFVHLYVHMNVSMCTRMCMCLCMNVFFQRISSVCADKRSVCMCVYLYVCMHVCMHVCIHACMYIRTFVCIERVFACMYHFNSRRVRALLFQHQQFRADISASLPAVRVSVMFDKYVYRNALIAVEQIYTYTNV